MRDIKFRVYDKELESFVNDFVIESTGDAVVFDEYGVAETLNADIEQFTGLTDKNGTDIYEGDIVNGFDSLLIGVIDWSDEDCAFTYSSLTSDAGAMLGTEYMCNFEVIGNIHQNPDLLK